METAQYPFLDLMILPELRGLFVSPRAALLFSPGFSHILWANSEGVKLAGQKHIQALVEDGATLSTVALRQVESAAEDLTGQESVSSSLRVRKGFKTQLTGFTLHKVELPDGAFAVLFVSDDLYGRSYDEREAAGEAIAVMRGYSRASCLFRRDGTIIAASDDFAETGQGKAQLSVLGEELANEDDRQIKRILKTDIGMLPCGIARLQDDPALNLMVLADPVEDAEKELASPKSAMTDEPAIPESPVSDTNNTIVETAADESAEATPVVGAFSSKRLPVGASGLGRWYYKNTPSDPQSSPQNAEEALPVGTAETGSAKSEEAEVVHATSAQSTDAASSSGLVQIVEGTPIQAMEQTQTDETVADVSKNVFSYEPGSGPVRFVWEMDASKTFKSVSAEFAGAVGPATANIVGKSWHQVAHELNIDGKDAVSAALEKTETWSGKTVLWPIDQTDLRVPVDLAGLPTFDRDRAFAGFNGFGIVRLADVMVDDRSVDEATIDEVPHRQEDLPPPVSETEQATPSAPSGFAPGKKSVLQSLKQRAPAILAVPFSQRGSNNHDETAPPQSQPEAEQGRALSDGEREAFEEIGEKLSAAETDKSDEAPKVETEASGATSPNPPVETIPSAFAPPRYRRSTHNEDTSILERLPIPVLVYRREELLFANDEFFGLTGFQTLDDLAAGGGVDAIFGVDASTSTSAGAPIYSKSGERLPVDPNLQTVPWENARALMLTLRRRNPDEHPPSDTAREKSAETATREFSGSSEAPLTPPPAGNAEGHRNIMRSLLSVVPGTGGLLPRSLSDAKPNEAAKRVAPTEPAFCFSSLDNNSLEGIVELASDGVLILSKQGRLQGMNSAAESLFEQNRGEVAGLTLESLFAPESAVQIRQQLEAVIERGERKSIQVIGQKGQGSMVPLQIALGKLRDVEPVCAVVRDLTDWKKSEQDLMNARQTAENASREKTEFLARVSHEIRTPLNAISGFSDMMIQERFGPIENDRYRGYLRDIQRSSSHILELINDLLDISRIEAGQHNLNFEICDLNPLISQTIALTQPQASSERVIIRTSLSTVVPPIEADRKSLRQIILNLVSNGIKYTRAGGQVIVSTIYDEEGEVVLRVRDTGIGMSEQDAIEAMKPFSRLATHAGERQGTGLGLPLTKSLVEANGARFHLESKPGEGTLVEINFPSSRVRQAS